MVIDACAAAIVAQHHRIEFVAVVQHVDAVAVRERHAGRAGEGRQKLWRTDAELVVKSVPRRRFDGGNQVTDGGHRGGAERPPPFACSNANSDADSHGHQDQSSFRARVQNEARPFGGRFSGSRASRRRVRRSSVGRRQPEGWLRGRGTRTADGATCAERCIR